MTKNHDLNVLINTLLDTRLLSTGSFNYPPVNILQVGDDLELQMAVSGFSRDELEIEFDGQQLTIRGSSKQTDPDSSTVKFLTRELAQRDFYRCFAVSGQYEPQQPTLVNGILTVKLINTVKKQRLTIAD